MFFKRSWFGTHIYFRFHTHLCPLEVFCKPVATNLVNKTRLKKVLLFFKNPVLKDKLSVFNAE